MTFYFFFKKKGKQWNKKTGSVTMDTHNWKTLFVLSFSWISALQPGNGPWPRRLLTICGMKIAAAFLWGFCWIGGLGPKGIG